MGSKSKLALSTKRLSRRKSSVKKCREKRLKLLNSNLAAQNAQDAQNAESKNKFTNHQYCMEPKSTAITNTNLEVKSEQIYYLHLPTTEEIEYHYDINYYDINHFDINHYDINHYDINHYDIKYLKEEIEICEDIYEYIEYLESNENNCDRDNQNIEDNSEKDNNCVSHDNREEIQVHGEKDKHNGNLEDCKNYKITKNYKNLINRPPAKLDCIKRNLPKGRYIVDISFIFNEIHRTFDNHARGVDCHFKYWELVNSRRCGLLTQFFFKCQMCHYEDSIWSEPMKAEVSMPLMLDVNIAVAAGANEAGISYSQLRKLCANMDIVCMSNETYIKYREKLVDIKHIKEIFLHREEKARQKKMELILGC